MGIYFKKCLKITLFIFLFTFTINANASEYEFDFAKRWGGTGSEVSRSVVLDTENNSYITGYFTDTVNFGGGDITAIGSSDIFILKLDEDGNFVWVETFGGADNDSTGFSVALDNDNNLYATGLFNGTVNFGGGDITAIGSSDIFILKLDEDGNFVWVETFGGAYISGDWDTTVYSIALDSNNNSYITGTFEGIVNFGGGDITATTGSSDSFILKLDEDGNFIWVETFNDSIGKSISVDNYGSLYITGEFFGTVNFGGGNLVTNGSWSDIFVLKLDEDGNFVWVETFGGINPDKAYNLIVDEENNSYITGNFRSTVDFGGGNITAVGGDDIFILKLDEDGNFVWVETFGGASIDTGRSITQDNDSIYVTGHGRSNLFNVTIENITTAPISYIGFITKISKDTGVIDWIKGVRDMDIGDRFYDISIDNSDNLYITGTFSGTLDFDLSDQTYNLTTEDSDIFVLKLSAIVPEPVVTPTPTPQHGSVSLAFLISMNQQNQLNNPQPQTQPQTPTQPLTNCKSGDIFSNTTGERCNTPLPPFNTNLSLNSNNQDILKLQQFLNKNNFLLTQTGPGSPNNETNFFGPLTRNALIRFQTANNITPAIGYFGPITRARVNEMLGN